MKIFLIETVKVAPRQSENRSCSFIVLEVLQDRWNSMKDTIFIFSSRYYFDLFTYCLGCALSIFVTFTLQYICYIVYLLFKFLGSF